MARLTVSAERAPSTLSQNAGSQRIPRDVACKAEGMRSRLVVVLPGRGYGPQGAALRFPLLAIEQLGSTESMVIAYPSIPSGTADPTSVLADAVADQVLPVVIETSTDEVVFVAKSLGTQALSGFCERLPPDLSAHAIWMTPLFGIPEVRDRAAASGLRSLIVAGDADPYHDHDGFDLVAAALNASTLLVAGADHSLEVPGDAHASIRALTALTSAVIDFMARGSG